MGMSTPTSALALLLLGDGRFPAGSHVHSGGVESAVADGRIADVDGLEEFVRGRLATAGLQDAALAASTHRRLVEAGAQDVESCLRELDLEADARVPVEALRLVSRRLGRQLLRVAARCWPSALVVTAGDAALGGLHHPVALGVVATSAGLGEADAALLALHHLLMTTAQAGVRLLGLDPFAVAALTAGADGQVRALVERAVVAAGGALADLPADSGPLSDIAAAGHTDLHVRLFAS